MDAKYFKYFNIAIWLCFLPFTVFDRDWIVLVVCLSRCHDIKMS